MSGLKYLSSFASKAKDDSTTSAPVGSIAARLNALASAITGIGSVTPGLAEQQFTSGSTFTITANATKNIFALIKPAGLLAAATINLPVGAFTGQRVVIKCTQVVTILNLAAPGSSVRDALGAFLLNGYCEYIWSGTDLQWNRIG